MKHFLAFLVAALILPGCGGNPTPNPDPDAPTAGDATPDADTLMDDASFDAYEKEQAATGGGEG
jgi:hypothetical protein